MKRYILILALSVATFAITNCSVYEEKLNEVYAKEEYGDEEQVDDGYVNAVIESVFNNESFSSPFTFSPKVIKALSHKAKHPHTDLSVIEIIRLHKYDAEIHTVVTDDGYVLEMHRISGSKKSPTAKGKKAVLLQHGILSSSIDWVVAGPNRGFAFLLADAGYDVWMGNVRGNVYSRRHENYTDDHSEYWKFSWHEIGVYDLPTMINHVLKVSGQQKLYYLGHSQGSTSFFVMASVLPEYNDKIHAMFSLAPVVYCSHMRSAILQIMARLVRPINFFTWLFGVAEFKPTNSFFTKITNYLCQDNMITHRICKNILFMIGGFNNDQMDTSLLTAILSHIPAGASVNQFVHYAQLINSGEFQYMDHGGNVNSGKYGSKEPPLYNLTNIRAPVSLHYSLNDLISHPKDVHQLYTKLPNPIGQFRVPNYRFTHLDYLWAKDVKKLLYDKIMSLMKQYTD